MFFAQAMASTKVSETSSQSSTVIGTGGTSPGQPVLTDTSTASELNRPALIQKEIYIDNICDALHFQLKQQWLLPASVRQVAMAL